ncbi:hypothetical protein [Cupriavidus sp. UME77]|uniref:hypothetical protein n=1 Tax=Cupriavidus sp. UME77 TaxID=1862321 RepID=UPI0015FEC1D4|nr:hypothetical protein [Cupriavidus sp. UME77]
MKYSALVLVGLFLVIGVFANATSCGRKATADIDSIDSKPAICLPKDSGKAFSVGWISVYESYAINPSSWGAALEAGARPLALKPGDCIVFGVAPDGYELDSHKINNFPLKLEANRTYVFRISDAYHPRDSYSAVFCVSKSADGAQEYRQYTRLPDGSEVIPSCDAKLNGNFQSN